MPESMPVPLRVFLVEDQMLVREGLKGLLGLCPDIALVGDAEDGLAALPMIESLRPDLVLADVRMPRLDGIGLIRAIAARGLTIPVVLITTFDDEPAFEDAVHAGARGFLLKDVSVERLRNTLREVAAGTTALRPGLTERIERKIEQPLRAFIPSDLPDALSPKEVQVLRLVASGRSNPEIARLLGNSEGVIRNHCSSVFSKLGVRDRTQAVLRAIDLDLL
ncbi:response regulator transcription factor [Niveibacterium sp. SC-1]|uniref:response regulator transcription factor n=1 Tax=Niveibacterium sp. SC-1 TaxID=3135646 RepID=UPI00311EB4B7